MTGWSGQWRRHSTGKCVFVSEIFVTKCNLDDEVKEEEMAGELSAYAEMELHNESWSENMKERAQHVG
jgi:hypothetical protein